MVIDSLRLYSVHFIPLFLVLSSHAYKILFSVSVMYLRECFPFLMLHLREMALRISMPLNTGRTAEEEAGRAA